MDYHFRETSSKWVWAGGAGFRYLVSRLFNLRAGVDIARGPDAFAYYIVFGHSWNRYQSEMYLPYQMPAFIAA